MQPRKRRRRRAPREPVPEAQQQRAAPAPQPPTPYRCGECGAGFRVAGDPQGVACPACGAQELSRLDAPGGAVDYVLADRTHGTTAEDAAFAQWAKWCNDITPHQYDLAVHRQNSELAQTGSARPIHEVMISEGLIDQKTAEALLRFLTLPRPDAVGEDFVRRLLLGGSVDKGQVSAICDLQRRMAGTRSEVPPISQLLLTKGVIDEVTMLTILRQQAEANTGSLRLAQAMKGPQVGGSLLSRPAARRFILRVAAGAVAALVLGSLLFGFAYKPQPTTYVKCKACGAVSEVPAPEPSKGWPVQCPVCGRKEAWPGFKCVCGQVFMRSSPGSFEPCPACGRTLEGVSALSEEDAIDP